MERKIKNVRHGHYIGRTTSPEASAWLHMKQRCYNKNSAMYYCYGGRGIKVCKRWLNSFDNFLLDMGLRPSPKHSLDRKNSNRNYSPANCKWSTTEQQANNRRTVKLYNYKGQKLSLSQIARQLGIPYARLYGRIRVSNWTLEQALTTSKF